MTTDGYDIRVMTAQDRARAVDWAAAEGWNPGAHDMDCFAGVDANGFFGGWLDGEMIAAISVVNYDDAFAFLGFYIVRPDFRGRGYGLRLWQAACTHAAGRLIGLDGVLQEQENYRRSGFDLAWRNIRFGGVPEPRPQLSDSVTIRPLTDLTPQVAALDARVFPAPRPAFWREWFGADGHQAAVALEAGETVGFATVRPCREGFKIGPLVARDRSVAEALLADLLTAVPDGQPVFLDVPEPNGDAQALARTLGLAPVFETARMYTGAAPVQELSLVYGVTSFELG